MKIIGKLISRISVLILGVAIGIVLPIKWIGTVDEVALFSFDGHLWERIFDVINALLLLVTLLTAIFKEQILARIYCPKFEITKDNDYNEIAENFETGYKVTSYEKNISVKNVGNSSAKHCKLILESVSIKSDNDYCATDINLNEVEIIPQCLKLSTNILKPQGLLSFSMFRILPKVGPHDDIPERPMLFLIGDNEIDIKQGKTDYTIVFHIEDENAQSTTNKIVIHWNGKWYGKKSEMKKVLSIEHVS